MTYGQMGTVCPQCGNTDAVHSIQELAAMARARLGQQGPVGPQPGTPAPPPGTPGQPGWAAEPQAGWMDEPQAGPLPSPGGRRNTYQPRSYSSGDTSFDSGSFGDDIAGAVLGAATGAAAKFLSRQIGKRMQDRLSQMQPAMAAKQQSMQAMMQTQIAIAERHPDLCACLNDQVIFLNGGNRTLPMPNLMTVTVEQADAMVTTLRDG